MIRGSAEHLFSCVRAAANTGAACPRTENASFTVQGHGNFGLKFLLKCFVALNVPAEQAPKTSPKTSLQTSPRNAPLQNANFAQNFAAEPFAN